MKRVYCSKCEHYRDRGMYSECGAEPEIKHNFYQQYKQYGDCEKLNEKNDCAKYAPSWWTRLMNRFSAALSRGDDNGI